VDSIIVDREYLSLLDDFKKSHPNVRLIVDLVSTFRIQIEAESLILSIVTDRKF
jgi:hypothetical protein